MNPYRDLEESSFTAAPHLNYEDIATKLLKDHYFLTALELHTELVESGKELPQLREFFSNPGNFEQHVSRATDFTSMHRTPSIATLDSLDTTRYSEDGGGDRGGSGGDVAVLEFELRKARETINSLRANLTQFADNDSPLDKNAKDSSGKHTLKPHEKRALNFLINEYLLLQDYKLTSITFSDENPDQDFEDWDDVGLNIPRPSGLGALLYGSDASLRVAKCDASTEMTIENVDFKCQTDIEDNLCTNCQHALDIDGDWNHEILIQAEEIRLLKQKVIALETEKHNFQKLYDAAIVSLNSLTSPISENKGIDLKIPDERLQVQSQLNDPPLTLMAADNHYGSNPHSMHSTTPDQFELIDNEKYSLVRKEGSNTSSFDPAIVGDNSAHDSPLCRGSVTTLDETLSINDAGEWTRIQYDYPVESSSKDMWIDSGLPNNLKAYLLNCCRESLNTNEPLSNELLIELINCDKPVSMQDLLNIVADTIPKVLPHTLVGRRCEMTALLVATIHLLSVTECSDTSKRARLLHLLLTLKKAPDAAETKIICEAACLIVKWGNSGEVLSCIAELLSSRTAERRVVASQICLAVAPFVSIELSTSLLLSLVIMMCESNELEIRSLGLKAVSLISAVADHKYSQLEGLLFGFLKDPSEGIIKETVNIFVPVLARTALIAGKFTTDLMSKIMANILRLSEEKEWKSLILYLNVMRSVVLAKLSYVINVQIIRDATVKNCDKDATNYHDISLDNVQDCNLDLQCFISDSCDCKLLFTTMNCLLSDNPDVRWDELNWFVDVLRQLLGIAVNSKCLNQAMVYEQFIVLINNYVESFGARFTSAVMKPIFLEFISSLECKMEKLHSVVSEDAIVVGIYCVAVLPVVETKEEIVSFLHKWIVYCSIRSFPVKVLSVPLRWVNKYKQDTIDIYLQLFKDFAMNTSESASGATIRAWICSMIAEFIDASVVNEKSLETLLLPTVMTMLHDSDVSVREPAISAWGAIARSCDTRNLECSTQCWSSMESFIGNDGPGLSSREAARTAESLALLVLPTMDNMGNSVCHQAVDLICELCMRAPLSADCLSAVAPAMQLAALHARTHPKIRPALKRLEEASQNPALGQYKPAIEAMIYNVAGAPPMSNASDVSKEHHQRAATTNLQAAQEVGRRVTQMFQQSKSNMNLQSIFKKKT